MRGSSYRACRSIRPRRSRPERSGPILRNKAWFFGAYRRVQQDQTFNNAPVPVERRGNLWFVKGTTQLHTNHRLSISFQYDRTTQANAVIRGSVAPARALGTLT